MTSEDRVWLNINPRWLRRELRRVEGARIWNAWTAIIALHIAAVRS